MDSAYIKFNGGIWSEVLKGRYDLGNYKSASRTCENFIPTRYGQVEKRSGTKHLGFAKNDGKVCVLHPFQYSVNTKFMLEFGDLYIRFWSNDLQVESAPSTPLEVVTPYLEAELYELQMRAVNDVVYIVHPNNPVGKLTRLADDNWTYAVADLSLPFVEPDVNSSEVTLTPSATTGTGVDIVASADAFDADHVGSILRLEYLLDGSAIASSFYDVYYPDVYNPDDYSNPLDRLTPWAKTDTYDARLSLANPATDYHRVFYTQASVVQHATCVRDYTPTAWGGYNVGDYVTESGSLYRCLIAHNSGVFATDLAAGKWVAESAPVWVAGLYSAGELVNHNGTYYICEEDVVIWQANRTPDDPDVKEYWTALLVTDWATGTVNYAETALTLNAGDVYYCIQAHTASAVFADDLAAGYWTEVTYPLDAPAYWEAGITAIPPQEVTGEWSFKTTGTWTGTWWIQRSVDDGATWSTIKALTSANDANYLVEEDEEGEPALIRVVSKAAASNYQADVTLTILSSPAYGTAKITSVTDGQNVVVDVITALPKISSSVSWKESAFSNIQGYPRAIAMFDSRLLLAGTKKKPQAFFYSGIGAYDDFLAQNTLADSPFFVEALSDDQSSIQWLTAQRELFVGTASVEGVLMTRKQDEAQSPENLPIVRWNESMGSAHRAALPMRDSLMCLQRGRTTVNMLAYSLERDGYTGEEVSLLCNHLFSSGVQQMAHLREPYTGAYTIQEDGTLCHMVYEPKLEVTAWCKFTTQNGSFESVAVLPSSNSSEDEVWCVVKRLVNGVTKRHIERFTIDNRAKQEASDTDNLWYLDAGVKSTGTNLTTVSGLDHLEGETVCVLADGIKGEYTVASGAITLSIPADTVIVGLPVTSEFEPLDLEVSFKEGATYGKRKQLYQSKLMMHKSLGGAVAFDGQEYQDIVYHTSGELMDSSIPLKSGYAEVFHESSHARQKYWRIKHDEPHPFTLQAVVQSFTVSKG